MMTKADVYHLERAILHGSYAQCLVKRYLQALDLKSRRIPAVGHYGVVRWTRDIDIHPCGIIGKTMPPTPTSPKTRST